MTPEAATRYTDLFPQVRAVAAVVARPLHVAEAALHRDPAFGYFLIALVALGAVLVYGVACAFWPYGACRRCRGAGKAHAWFGGKGFRYCRRCKGSGARLRTGRVIYNHIRRLHKDSR